MAMRTMRSHFPALLCLLALASVVSAAAQEDTVSGEVVVGWRFASTDGAEGKYRQHVNLDEGARLFKIDFDYRPSSDFADLVELNVDSLGGEPYEQIDFEVRKFGSYRFDFGRRKSEYFYEDLLLPAESVDPRTSNGGDFHHFDFERVRDFAALELQLRPRTRLDVRFDRFSKDGESTTVLDVSRDEFELDQPLSEEMDQISVALQHGFERATLVVEETYRTYDNTREIFLPGQSEGENPGPAILDFYFLDQPVDSRANRHSVRLNAKPRDDLIVRAAAQIETLDLDFDAAERGKGISFSGAPLAFDDRGQGDVSRDFELFDVDVSWLLNDRLALVGGVRRHQLDQDGQVDFPGSDAQRSWDVDTTAADVGLEIAATADLTVTVGLLQEERDASEILEGEAHEVSTEHTGGFVTAQWRPSKALKVGATYENSSYDDPFTLASPTDRDRLRLNVRYRSEQGAFVQGTYLLQETDNGNSDWQVDYDSFTVRGGVRRGDLEISAGYAFIDVERSVDQTVTTLPGFGGGQQFAFPVFFVSDADFFDLRVRYRVSERVQIGAEGRVYDNSGSFATERDDLRAFAEIELGEGYLLHLRYRDLDYSEDAYGLNDYTAEIFELGVGYRF